eukprot:Sspe_Gene.82688::Locus_54199_Transcript_1_1_Confidence_1.000_Length_761::g.82688::m.82688/K00799/GST, gst; glutathione S-transferase
MPKVELYLARVSVTCHGPWLLLSEAKVDYELKDIDIPKGETRTPEFMAMNPMHSVPTLKDADGTCVWESNAILRYIANKYPSARKFYPEDPKARALCDMALDWRSNVLYSAIGDVVYPKFGFAPEDAAKAAKGIERLTNDLDGAFKVLTEFFLKGKPFVGGDQPSIADFAIVPAFNFLDVAPEVTIPDAITQYRERFLKATGYSEIENGAGGFGVKQFVAMKKGEK